MLENAEVSIEKAESVKTLKGLPNQNPTVNYQNQVKSFLKSKFKPHQLPNDMVRLVGSVINLINIMRIDLRKLEISLDKDSAKGRGVNTLNLSPYLILIQALIDRRTATVVNFLKRNEAGNKNIKLFLPKEVDVSRIKSHLPNKNVIR